MDALSGLTKDFIEAGKTITSTRKWPYDFGINRPLAPPPKTVTVTHKSSKKDQVVTGPKKVSLSTVTKPIGAKPYLADLPPNPFHAKSNPPMPKKSILINDLFFRGSVRAEWSAGRRAQNRRVFSIPALYRNLS